MTTPYQLVRRRAVVTMKAFLKILEGRPQSKRVLNSTWSGKAVQTTSKASLYI